MEEEEKVQRLRWSSTQRVGSGKSWLCAVERERERRAGRQKKESVDLAGRESRTVGWRGSCCCCCRFFPS
jgi:hypothetical protein